MQRDEVCKAKCDEKHAWILPPNGFSGKNQSCIARQPILTSDEEVVGYELFFREGPGQNRFTSDPSAPLRRPLTR